MWQRPCSPQKDTLHVSEVESKSGWVVREGGDGCQALLHGADRQEESEQTVLSSFQEAKESASFQLNAATESDEALKGLNNNKEILNFGKQVFSLWQTAKLISLTYLCDNNALNLNWEGGISGFPVGNFNWNVP